MLNARQKEYLLSKKTIYVWGSSASYSRTKVILDGFKKEGYTIEVYTASGRDISSKLKLIGKYLKIPKYSLVYIPSLNHINSIIYRLLNILLPKKHYVIFDPLVSRYDTQVNDRKKYHKNSIKAAIDKIIDRFSMNWVNCLMTDTEEHQKYFIENFNIDSNKIVEIPVGAPEEFFKSEIVRKKNKQFQVIFYGNYIPLHGIETIIKAFEFLKDYPISLTLIGKGQTYTEMTRLADSLNLSNVTFLDYMSFDNLIKYLTTSDLGLGVFGISEKAGRVVPNKVYQMAALGLPFVSRKSEPVERYFGENVIYIDAGDSSALASAILEAYNSHEKLTKNSLKLREISKKYYTPHEISKKLLRFIRVE